MPNYPAGMSLFYKDLIQREGDFGPNPFTFVYCSSLARTHGSPIFGTTHLRLDFTMRPVRSRVEFLMVKIRVLLFETQDIDG
jgi:hypothetical protein